MKMKTIMKMDIKQLARWQEQRNKKLIKRSDFKITDQLANADIIEESRRQVEEGHGRKRSREWNAEERAKLQKEIEELRQRRARNDLGDNDFDRMAMK